MKRSLILMLFLPLPLYAQPVAFPCDVIWERFFNYTGTEIGPSWNVGDSTKFLISTSTREEDGMLLELVNGRTVRATAPLGYRDIIVQRLDILENPGFEFIVIANQDGWSFLMILDSSYDLLRTDTLGREWREGTWQGRKEIVGFRWIGGEDSLVAISDATSLERWQPGVREGSSGGGQSVYSLRDRTYAVSTEIGTPCVDYWRIEGVDEDMVFFGGSFATGSSTEWGGSLHTWTQVATMSSRLESQRFRGVSDRNDPNYERGNGPVSTSIAAVKVVVTPEHGTVGFIALNDNSRYYLAAYTLPELDPIGSYELPERVRDLEVFSNFGVEDPHPYLFCFGYQQLKLFDLVDFQMVEQAYFTPFTRSVQTADFDGDGRIEMAGNDAGGGIVKLIRPRSLDATPHERSLFPSTLTLSAPFPNPFNSSTTISYSLPHPGRYALDIVDISGRLVTRLSDGWKEAGSYREVLNADRIGSGSYFVTISNGAGSAQTAPIILLK